LHPETDSAMYLYAAAKAIAEKKIWQIARNHPDVDVTMSEGPKLLHFIEPY
jgi:hypothetical protein